MGRTIIRIPLSGEEEQTLRMWVGAYKTEQRMVQRAKVILYSPEGLPLPSISEKSGLGKQNCSKWRKRFSENRLEGYEGPGQTAIDHATATSECHRARKQ